MHFYRTELHTFQTRPICLVITMRSSNQFFSSTHPAAGLPTVFSLQMSWILTCWHSPHLTSPDVYMQEVIQTEFSMIQHHESLQALCKIPYIHCTTYHITYHSVWQIPGNLKMCHHCDISCTNKIQKSTSYRTILYLHHMLQAENQWFVGCYPSCVEQHVLQPYRLACHPEGQLPC